MIINSRQVYPFYPNIKDEDAIIDPGLCALTIYCDVENSGFWSDLQHLPGLFTSDLQEKYPELRAASLEVVQEALRELRLLFNVKNIPYPVSDVESSIYIVLLVLRVDTWRPWLFIRYAIAKTPIISINIP